MRKLYLSLLAMAMVCIGIAQHVVPASFASTAGTGTFSGPLVNGARTYQLLINENQLTSIVGKRLSGITFRIPTSATAAWPTADAVFSAYDIYLGESVAPAQRSSTFANNAVGQQVQVRSGTLTIPANSFASGNTPNEFGTYINFTTPYLYTGGHLLVEIRHSGFSGTSRSTDALISTTAGYGTDFSALWQSGATATTGSQGNFSVLRFAIEENLPVVLTSFTAERLGHHAKLIWNTASEVNTSRFVLQKSTDGINFVQIGSVPANSPTGGNYQWMDRDAMKSSAKKIFYRLKIQDRDGSAQISSIATIKFGKVATTFTLLSNPVQQQAIINVHHASREVVTFTIASMDGRVVKTFKQQLERGDNSVRLNVSELLRGNYIIRCVSANVEEVLKLVKE